LDKLCRSCHGNKKGADLKNISIPFMIGSHFENFKNKEHNFE
jgi:hypothetical protein